MFAMFLLVLVLMVLATMSLTRLTHQKMELQVANDAAAYSQAVATARAYNSVALLNRAQVATMVALAGVDSAVSFGGSYRASLNATWYGYVDEYDTEYCEGPKKGAFPSPRRLCGKTLTSGTTGCNNRGFKYNFSFFGFKFQYDVKCKGDSCDVERAIFGSLFYDRAVEDSKAAPLVPNAPYSSNIPNDNARLVLIRNELSRVKWIWQALDDAAGLQARNVQAEAMAYGDLQSTALSQARQELEPFSVASLAAAGATPNLPSLAVATREFDDGTGSGIQDNSIDAAMGSRAHLFITKRIDGVRAIQDQLRRVLKNSTGFRPAEVTVLPMKGNGYFATSKNHGARAATGYSGWGDEESRVTVDYLGPDAAIGVPGPGVASGNLAFEGYVGSTDEQNTEDNHDWCPGDILPEPAPAERHTMLPHGVPPSGIDPCIASSCIWPSFLDSNPGNVDNPADVFGQPKLFAAATRDLSGQKDALEIKRTFAFKAGGTGATADFRAKHAVAGVNQQLQSVAAAMAYYHRPNHWKEPPNLFNPYWRATLVRANVDGTWAGDLGSAVAPQYADALNELVRVGFQGIP